MLKQADKLTGNWFSDLLQTKSTVEIEKKKPEIIEGNEN